MVGNLKSVVLLLSECKIIHARFETLSGWKTCIALLATLETLNCEAIRKNS